MEHDEFLQVIRSPFHFATCDAVLRGCKIVDISKPLQWRRLSKKVRSHPLAPSAKRLRPQAVGERTVRLPEIFRAMARFSPSAPSGHRSPSGASATSPVSGESVSQREVFLHAGLPRGGRLTYSYWFFLRPCRRFSSRSAAASAWRRPSWARPSASGRGSPCSAGARAQGRASRAGSRQRHPARSGPGCRSPRAFPPGQ